MKIYTVLLNDTSRTVVTHFVCEDKEELDLAIQLALLEDSKNVDYDNLGWNYEGKKYFGCVRVYTTDFDEIID